jgi:hypothetical protein
MEAMGYLIVILKQGKLVRNPIRKSFPYVVRMDREYHLIA